MSPSFELPLYYVACCQWQRKWPSKVIHLWRRALLCSSVTKHFISSAWSPRCGRQRALSVGMLSLNWKHCTEGLKWNKTTDFGGALTPVSNTEAGYKDSWNVTATKYMQSYRISMMTTMLALLSNELFFCKDDKHCKYFVCISHLPIKSFHSRISHNDRPLCYLPI